MYFMSWVQSYDLIISCFYNNMYTKYLSYCIMIYLHSIIHIIRIWFTRIRFIYLCDCHLRNLIQKYLKLFHIFRCKFLECIPILQMIFKTQFKRYFPILFFR